MATNNRNNSSQKRSNTTSNRGNTTRNNTRKNTTRSTSSKQKNTISDDDLLVLNYIVFIAAIALCVFLFVCTIVEEGFLCQIFKSLMFGLFGKMAYVFPVFLVILAFLWISKQTDSRYNFKFVAFIILFVFVGVIFDMGKDGYSLNNSSYSLVDLYNHCKENLCGGGLLEGTIAYFLYFLCKSKIFVLFISIVMILISLLLIFGRGLIDFVYRLYYGISNTAKVANEYRKEHLVGNAIDDDEARPKKNRIQKIDLLSGESNAELNNSSVSKEDKKAQLRKKKEEAETDNILRMDKRVSGISQNTIIKNDSVKKQDDMHEIIIKDDTETLPKKEIINVKDNHIMDNSIRFHTADYDDGYAVNNSAQDISKEDFKEIVSEVPVFDVPNKISKNVSDKNNRVHSTKESSTIKETLKTDSIDSKSEDRVVKTTKEVKKDYSNEKYKFPPLSLLSSNENKNGGDSRAVLGETAKKLENALESFGVKAKVTDISQGPSVTRYELEPAVGVKVSRITSLADDLKLHLAAKDIRIEAPIPGKSAVGIEVPNTESSGVKLRELFEDNEFRNFKGNILFAVGKDISGKVIVTDISKMPHMLIAGSTGSGKSVCINTLIMSIIFKHDPKDVQLIMVDPKVVELNIYNGIPHLMIPVVTDPKKAAGALNWAVAEMTDRYKKFADLNVRDLKGYNQKVAEMSDESGEYKHLPQIVIIVDELADLMMVAAKEVEESICRLAQLARACGIHLILATQRPSVDVITGLIKANMPSRVAFAVSSSIDSRTILDMNGAEKLLGKGDMLFYPQGYTKPARLQGAFVSDNEVADVVEFIKNQKLHNEFGEKAQESVDKVGTSAGSSSGTGDGGNDLDDLFSQAGYFIIEANKASIGNLQRKFKIGFNRAARIMDQLSEAGVVGPEQGTKPREILMSQEQFDQYIEDYV